jgi:hypothetical protein
MATYDNISRYIHISNQGIMLNNDVIYRPDNKLGSELLVDAFKTLGLNYPKFYKMDNLCKLAVLATELLLRNTDFAGKYKPEDIAVIVSTANSSLDTDRRYWDSVVAGAPSPSLFVYTLPNVMLGEICIRWVIKVENTCLASEQFDAAFRPIMSIRCLIWAMQKCVFPDGLTISMAKWKPFLCWLKKISHLWRNIIPKQYKNYTTGNGRINEDTEGADSGATQSAADQT